MLPKKNRLTGKDIHYLFKKISNKRTNKIFTKNFAVYYLIQDHNRTHNQISITIPRSAVKLASQRHRIKRQIYNYIHKELLSNNKIWHTRKKIFITINKKKLQYNAHELFNNGINYFKEESEQIYKQLNKT